MYGVGMVNHKNTMFHVYIPFQSIWGAGDSSDLPTFSLPGIISHANTNPGH
jgi:hypothetical protein